MKAHFVDYHCPGDKLGSSVLVSCSVMSDSLWSYGLQHTRLPCPSPTPGVYPNSCPLSRWCHPTILSSVVPFSSCLQSFPASGYFQVSQLFATGGQSIGVSASTSVLPMNTQTHFIHDGLVGSPCSPTDTQESSPTLLKVLIEILHICIMINDFQNSLYSIIHFS